MDTTTLIICIYALVVLTIMFIVMAISLSKDRKQNQKAGNTENKREIALEKELDETKKQLEEVNRQSVVKKEEESEAKTRFPMLTSIDKNMEAKQDNFFDNTVSLEDICDRLRNYSANQLKLYYSLHDIRSFVAGLGTSHLILMQGMSGTGKTSLAVAFGQFINNESTIVPVQPMWKESSDLIGYYNEFTNKFNETNMLYSLYRALYTKDIYITVLDEMNIARIEYYFAEFLSLLEIPNPNKRLIRVVSETKRNDPKKLKNGEILVSENMWFIGTANNDDSTFAISDKVYDRAMILNLDKRATPFEAPYTEPVRISSEHFAKLIRKAGLSYAITSRNLRRISLLDEYMRKNLHVSFGNRIMAQIKKFVSIYIACGGKEIEAIDDILAKKVMRKLGSQNPVFVKNALPGLYECINDLFGEEGLPMCKEFLNHIEMSV